MPNNKEKHYVFSARTTEKGLKLLNKIKKDLDLSWDELIINAVSSKYRINKADIEPPKKVRAPKPKAEKKAKAKAQKPKKAGKPKAVKKAKVPEAKKEGEPVTA